MYTIPTKLEMKEMELPEKLIIYRKKQGLTQVQLAEKLQVSRQAVSRWEHGTALPSMDSLRRLSQLYGVPLDLFVYKETEELIKTEPSVSVDQGQNSSEEMRDDREVIQKKKACSSMKGNDYMLTFLEKCKKKKRAIGISAVSAIIICAMCIVIYSYLCGGGTEKSISQDIISYREDASRDTSSGESFSLDW